MRCRAYLQSELRAPKSEIVCLLNRLCVDVGDMEKVDEWLKLLVDVIRSPAGLSLSIRYWHLLDGLVLTSDHPVAFKSCDVELGRLLEEAGRWEELEIWLAVAWLSKYKFAISFENAVGDLERATLKLLL